MACYRCFIDKLVPAFRADGREVKHFHKYQNYKSYEEEQESKK